MAEKGCLAKQPLIWMLTVALLLFGCWCLDVSVIMYGWAIFWPVSCIFVQVLSLAWMIPNISNLGPIAIWNDWNRVKLSDETIKACETLILTFTFVVHSCLASRCEVMLLRWARCRARLSAGGASVSHVFTIIHFFPSTSSVLGFHVEFSRWNFQWKTRYIAEEKCKETS